MLQYTLRLAPYATIFLFLKEDIVLLTSSLCRKSIVTTGVWQSVVPRCQDFVLTIAQNLL